MNEQLKQDFAATIEEHGEALFCLVWDSSMAQEALGVLVTLAQKHRSAGGMRAVEVVATSFNSLAEEIRAKGGWTEEQLRACDASIKEEFARKAAPKLIVPESGIILH